MTDAADPHAGQPVLTAGPAPADAGAGLILLHGRGSTADNMLGLYNALEVDRVAAIVPQAASNTWYPQSFLVPVEANQPYLDSALRRIASLVDELMADGVPAHRIAIMGFSQGACLTCEFVARNPRRYGAVMALTGGLIGAAVDNQEYGGSLKGTPVFLGTSDPDVHVPLDRVKETRDVLLQLGAEVDMRSYPGLPHTVNDDEIAACRQLLVTLVSSDRPDE